MRAVPNNELTAEELYKFFKQPKPHSEGLVLIPDRILEHFQWDKSGKKWEDYFDSEILHQKQILGYLLLT